MIYGNFNINNIYFGWPIQILSYYFGTDIFERTEISLHWLKQNEQISNKQKSISMWDFGLSHRIPEKKVF